MTLRSSEFRKGREKAWIELDELITRVEKRGIDQLTPDETSKLPLLYRGAVSSLSVARNIVLDRRLLLYLENLTLRAYLVVYGPRTGMLSNFGHFFMRQFPQTVRCMGPHFLFAAFLLFIGTVAGFLLTYSNINYFNVIVPEGLAGNRGPASTASDLMQNELFAPWPGFAKTFIYFANSLFRHNTLVGILSFGLGFALGVPTLFLLAYNGLILGAFLALHANLGLTYDFIGWLSIHGVTEITALLLCGAAGFLIAEKIIFPGGYSRLQSLAVHGRKAASAAAGSVLLFFIAGFLEGGFRQWIAHTSGRYLFALVTLVAWYFYFIYAGRREDSVFQK